MYKDTKKQRDTQIFKELLYQAKEQVRTDGSRI